MAHKTLIGGTNYEIVGGKTCVDGTTYKISGGKTLVGGTKYDVTFKKPTITMKGNGYYYATATIEGIAYKADQEGTIIEVLAGTEITLTVKDGTQEGYGEIKIYKGGTLVAQPVSGTAGTYVHTVQENITIEFDYKFESKPSSYNYAGIIHLFEE